MRSLKNCHAICFLLLLTLLSCSSEEEVVDFVGAYKSISLTYTACDDPAEDNDVWNADAQNRFCYEDDDAKKCFSLTVKVFEDRTFEHIFVDQVTRGGFSTSNPDKKVGNYTINQSNIELCPEDGTQCILMTMNSARTALLWEIQGTSCKRTHTIVKQ